MAKFEMWQPEDETGVSEPSSKGGLSSWWRGLWTRIDAWANPPLEDEVKPSDMPKPRARRSRKA